MGSSEPHSEPRQPKNTAPGRPTMGPGMEDRDCPPFRGRLAPPDDLAGLRDLVAAVGGDAVAPAPARDLVALTVARGDAVVAVAAGDRVSARAAVEAVGAGLAGHAIAPAAADERVVAGA